jgi:hypothetical protein
VVRQWVVSSGNVVNGTDGDDVIELRLNAEATELSIYLNPSPGSAPALVIPDDGNTRFSFVVNGLGGNDRLILPPRGPTFGPRYAFNTASFNGGEGDDAIEFSINDDDVVTTLHEDHLSTDFGDRLDVAGVEALKMNVVGPEGGDLHIAGPVPYQVQYHGTADTGALNIFGEPGDDLVRLSDSQITYGAFSASYSGIGSVSIQGQEGNDTIVVDSALDPSIRYFFDGDEGNDLLRITGGEISFFGPATVNSPVLLDTFDLELSGDARLNVPQNLTFENVKLNSPDARLNLLNGAALKAQSLTITDGLVDISTGGLVLSDMLTETVRELIVAGRGSTGGTASGRWNGSSGVTSSAAAEAFLAGNKESRSVGYARNGDLLQLINTFLGHHVVEGDVLVRFTKNADANLDGVVNNNDITLLAGNYRPGTPGKHWHNADFNYDGETNNNDITTLAGFYAPNEAPIPSGTSDDEIVLRRSDKPRLIRSFFADTSTILD